MTDLLNHKLAAISFATVLTDRIDLWPTISSHDTSEANNIGRQRALEILQYARENQAPMILGHVAAAIVRKGLYGAGETSFFHTIAMESVEIGATLQPTNKPAPDLHLVSSR